MFTTVLSLMVAAAAQLHVVATLEEPQFARMGIAADLVERPVGIADEQFAQI